MGGFFHHRYENRIDLCGTREAWCPSDKVCYSRLCSVWRTSLTYTAAGPPLSTLGKK